LIGVGRRLRRSTLGRPLLNEPLRSSVTESPDQDGERPLGRLNVLFQFAIVATSGVAVALAHETHDIVGLPATG
jgi:hypothetical protein